MQKSGGKVQLQDLGTWPFMVKGINTGSSWTTDPLLLKGFQGSSSGLVLELWFHLYGGKWRGEPLVPGTAGGQSSPAHALAA